MRFHFVGITISVLVHAALVSLIFYAGNSFAPRHTTLTLDFSILKSTSDVHGVLAEEQSSAVASAAVRSEESLHKQNRPDPKPQNEAPKPDQKRNISVEQPRKLASVPKKKPVLRRPGPTVKPKSPNPLKTGIKKHAPRDLSAEKPEPEENVKEIHDDKDTDPALKPNQPTEDQEVLPSPSFEDLAESIAHQNGDWEGVPGLQNEIAAQEVPGAMYGAHAQYRAGDGGGGDVKAAYYNAIRNRLRDRLHYPPIARVRGYAGKVVVSFTVSRDGTVQDLKIRKSCGVSILDKSALKTIRAACPFPRPSQMAKIVIPIEYCLN